MEIRFYLIISLVLSSITSATTVHAASSASCRYSAHSELKRAMLLRSPHECFIGVEYSPRGDYFLAHTRLGNMYQFSPGGHLMRSMIEDYSRETNILQPIIESITFNHDGSLFATCNRTIVRAKVKLWTQSGALLGQYRVSSADDTTITFSSRGNYCVFCDEKTVTLVDLRDLSREPRKLQMPPKLWEHGDLEDVLQRYPIWRDMEHLQQPPYVRKAFFNSDESLLIVEATDGIYLCGTDGIVHHKITKIDNEYYAPRSSLEYTNRFRLMGVRPDDTLVVMHDLAPGEARISMIALPAELPDHRCYEALSYERTIVPLNLPETRDLTWYTLKTNKTVSTITCLGHVHRNHRVFSRCISLFTPGSSDLVSTVIEPEPCTQINCTSLNESGSLVGIVGNSHRASLYDREGRLIFALEHPAHGSRHANLESYYGLPPLPSDIASNIIEHTLYLGREPFQFNSVALHPTAPQCALTDRRALYVYTNNEVALPKAYEGLPTFKNPFALGSPLPLLGVEPWRKPIVHDSIAVV